MLSAPKGTILELFSVGSYQLYHRLNSPLGFACSVLGTLWARCPISPPVWAGRITFDRCLIRARGFVPIRVLQCSLIDSAAPQYGSVSEREAQ
jgi:hypothetical protein